MRSIEPTRRNWFEGKWRQEKSNEQAARKGQKKKKRRRRIRCVEKDKTGKWGKENGWCAESHVTGGPKGREDRPVSRVPVGLGRAPGEWISQGAKLRNENERDQQRAINSRKTMNGFSFSFLFSVFRLYRGKKEGGGERMDQF